MAITIQASARRAPVRSEFLHVRQSATKIQALMRGNLVRAAMAFMLPSNESFSDDHAVAGQSSADDHTVASHDAIPPNAQLRNRPLPRRDQPCRYLQKKPRPPSKLSDRLKLQEKKQHRSGPASSTVLPRSGLPVMARAPAPVVRWPPATPQAMMPGVHQNVMWQAQPLPEIPSVREKLQELQRQLDQLQAQDQDVSHVSLQLQELQQARAAPGRLQASSLPFVDEGYYSAAAHGCSPPPPPTGNEEYRPHRNAGLNQDPVGNPGACVFPRTARGSFMRTFQGQNPGAVSVMAQLPVRFNALPVSQIRAARKAQAASDREQDTDTPRCIRVGPYVLRHAPPMASKLGYGESFFEA